MNVLTISNSFGVDATRYLHQIARQEDVVLNVACLYIGGCVLAKHYRNMISEERAYELYYNGSNTCFHVSMKEALLNRSWDVISIQQGSVHSAFPDQYEPYAESLAAYIRECCPKAKLIIQQTWAFEEGNERLEKVGFPSQSAMFAEIEKAYEKMVKTVDADGLIPSGKMVQLLAENGVKTHRDGLHVTRGLGRYALALLWYKTLTGKTVANNAFRDFDEPVTEEEAALAARLAEKLAPVV